MSWNDGDKVLWARGEHRALLPWMVPRFFTLPLASLETNWIQTEWMAGWVAQCVEKMAEPVVQH